MTVPAFILTAWGTLAGWTLAAAWMVVALYWRRQARRSLSAMKAMLEIQDMMMRDWGRQNEGRQNEQTHLQ